MGNYSTTKTEIKNYIFARVPLIIIQSAERARVEWMIAETAREMRIEVTCYSDTKQIYRPGQDTIRDVESDPIPFAMELLRRKRGTTFVLADVRRVSEENLYSREIVNLLYLAAEMGGTVILITPDPVWARIARMGMLTRLDLPDMDERTAEIREFVRRYGSRYSIAWDENDIQRASALLRGFTEIQIDNILSSALVENGALDRRHIYELTSQKSRMYEAAAGVQEVRVSGDLRISGLDNLKQWLAEKKRIFFASEEELAARGLQTPKGILLAGIPGCGKSFSARMVAREWELPLFKFDIGSIYDKWVGESEHRMADALQFIDNVAPCIVWIDEIEKALSVSDSSNDTGQRVLGQFLFWLQESSSRVFLVATANDIRKLPPELFRKGRFSEMFFVDLPTAAERAEAITQYMEQCLHRTPDAGSLQELVGRTKGFSYADIEYMVKEAAQKALLYGDDAVSSDMLLELTEKVIPFADTNPDVVSQLRSWGNSRAAAASLPEKGGNEA